MKCSKGFVLLTPLFFVFFSFFSSCGFDTDLKYKQILGLDMKLATDTRSGMAVLSIGDVIIRDVKTDRTLCDPDLKNAIILEERPNSNQPGNNKTRDYLFLVARDPLNPSYKIFYVVDVGFDLMGNVVTRAYAISEDEGTGTGEISGVERGLGLLGTLEERTKNARTILFGDGQKLYTAYQTPDSKWTKKEFLSFERPSIRATLKEGIASSVDIVFDFSRLDFKEEVKAYSNGTCLSSTYDPEKIIVSYEDDPSRIITPAISLKAKVAGVRDANAYSIGRTLAGVTLCSDPVTYTQFSYNIVPDLDLDHSLPHQVVSIIDLKNISPAPSFGEITPTYTFSYKRAGPSHTIEKYQDASAEELASMQVEGLLEDTLYVFKAKACMGSDACIDSQEVYIKTTTEFPDLGLTLKKNPSQNLHHAMKGFAKEVSAIISGVAEDVTYSLHRNTCDGLQIGPVLNASQARNPITLSILPSVPNTFVVKSTLSDFEKCSDPVTYTHLGAFEARVQVSDRKLTTFNLSWDNSLDLASYNLYMNGSFFLNTALNSSSLSDLLPDKNYGVLIRGLDFDGYESPILPATNVSTLPYSAANVTLTNSGGTDSYPQGYGLTVDFLVSGLSQYDDELITIHKTSTCLDIATATLNSNKATSVRLPSVAASLGLNSYYVARTLNTVTRCSPLASYERFSYLSEIASITQDALDYDTRAHVTFNPQTPMDTFVDHYSLYYQKDGETSPVEINLAVSPVEISPLVPGEGYSVWVKAHDIKGEVSLSSVALYTVPQTINRPVLTLKKDATTDLHSSLKGFAAELYGVISNTDVGAINKIHIGSCTGPEVSDSEHIAIVSASANTFYVSSTVGPNTSCSDPVTYIHLGDFDPGTLTFSQEMFSSFTASWATMPDVAQYRVYLDGVHLDDSSVNSYDFSNLSPGISYAILIKAEDYDAFESSNMDAQDFSLTYPKASLALYPPSSLTPINSESGYSSGFASSVDIVVSGLSSEDEETIELYAGQDCQGLPLDTHTKAILEVSHTFLNVTASGSSWSIKRTLNLGSVCSDPISYAKLTYNPGNVPTLANRGLNSLEVTFAPLAGAPNGTIYKVKKKKSTDLDFETNLEESSTTSLIISDLDLASVYTVKALVCDKHGICSSETNESLPITIDPCKDLQGGDYVWVPRLDSDYANLLTEFRDRAKAIETLDSIQDSIHPAGFCLMKYEARNLSSLPHSQAEDLPWSTITQTNAGLACASLGEGYRLAYNSEWMTVALNAEANSKNWSLATSGLGSLNRGLSNNILNMAASAGECLEAGNLCTGEDLSNAKWHVNRRTHYLSNGMPSSSDHVWDLAGSLQEWILWDSDISSLGGDQIGLAGGYWETSIDDSTNVKIKKTQVLPQFVLNSSRDPALAADNFGYYWRTSDPDAGAPMRGGDYNSDVNAGLFSLDLQTTSSYSHNEVGFRCVYAFPKVRPEIIEGGGTLSPVLKLTGLSPLTGLVELHTNSACSQKVGESVISAGEVARLEVTTNLVAGIVNEFWIKANSACSKLDLIYRSENPCQFLADQGHGEWIWVPKINEPKIGPFIPQSFRERADALELGEALGEKIGANGFCVMKYEASPDVSCVSACTDPELHQTLECLACTKAMSREDGPAWAYLDQSQANNLCMSISYTEGMETFTGRLLRNSEWMTMALNAEAQGENWDGGIAGVASKGMNRGLSDSLLSYPASAGDCLSGTDFCVGRSPSGWHLLRRTHKIANGLLDGDSLLWDLSGNLWEWTVWNSTTPYLGIDQMAYGGTLEEWQGAMVSVGKMTRENSLPGFVYDPNGVYYAGASRLFGNYGYYHNDISDPLNGAPIRGSSLDFQDAAGLYALELELTSVKKAGDIGFRCVIGLP